MSTFWTVLVHLGAVMFLAQWFFLCRTVYTGKWPFAHKVNAVLVLVYFFIGFLAFLATGSFLPSVMYTVYSVLMIVLYIIEWGLHGIAHVFDEFFQAGWYGKPHAKYTAMVLFVVLIMIVMVIIRVIASLYFLGDMLLF
ncbi:MAG: hypothetical protein R3Y62_02470 [Eubacteriales bacterium]